MAIQTVDRMDAFLERAAGYAVKTSAAAYAPDIIQHDISMSPKGIIEGRLTVNKNDDGSHVIDPYGDITMPHMFSASYKKLDNVRRQRGDSFLMPLLFQHNQNDVIGGVTHLEQKENGYVYAAQLVLGIKLARDCFELCKSKNLWSSYGYAPKRVSYKGKYRVLEEVDIHEISLVTFPANGLSGIISAKNAFTSYPSTKDARIWAKLAPADMRTQALESRWNALDPDIYSDETDEHYTIGDLLKSVHISIERG